ncbi:hypothetical protein [Pseudomonas phage Eisa9]|uniref:Uncharacterized protein n=1 Tax=Pseudomonas phage Eisa9 TaxID=2900148 RepID=A0AAE9C938_9CAUD|nr:hypothetical protein [Pseudomonas phage Eisa9]
MTRTEYQRLSDSMTAAIDTGNREYADEVFSQALLADGKTIDAAQFEDIADDYYAAISGGEI